MKTNYSDNPLLTIGYSTVFICSLDGNIAIERTPIKVAKKDYFAAAYRHQVARHQRPL